MKKNRLIAIIILFIGCSKQEQPIIFLEKEILKLIENEMFEIDFLNKTYFTYQNYLLISDQNCVIKFDVGSTSIDKKNEFCINLPQTDISNIYFSNDSIVTLLYSDSFSIFNIYNNSLIAKERHNFFKNNKSNLPLTYYIYSNQFLINNQIYFQNYKTECQDKPEDCDSHFFFWTYDLNQEKLKKTNFKLDKIVYRDFLKYADYFSSCLKADTIVVLSNYHGIVNGFNTSNMESFSKSIKIDRDFDYEILETDDYMNSIVQKVSFGPGYSNIQYNKSNGNFYFLSLLSDKTFLKRDILGRIPRFLVI